MAVGKWADHFRRCQQRFPVVHRHTHIVRKCGAPPALQAMCVRRALSIPAGAKGATEGNTVENIVKTHERLVEYLEALEELPRRFLEALEIFL